MKITLSIEWSKFRLWYEWNLQRGSQPNLKRNVELK